MNIIVLDPAGAHVQDAPITLPKSATGEVRNTTSSSIGTAAPFHRTAPVQVRTVAAANATRPILPSMAESGKWVS